MDEALLKVENVEIRFGGIVALQGVSLRPGAATSPP
jgi:ABC-type branched-subunit amino acid transport system ATPase component